MMEIINASFNFYIYCMCNQEIRSQVWNLLHLNWTCNHNKMYLHKKSRRPFILNLVVNTLESRAATTTAATMNYHWLRIKISILIKFNGFWSYKILFKQFEPKIVNIWTIFIGWILYLHAWNNNERWQIQTIIISSFRTLGYRS